MKLFVDQESHKPLMLTYEGVLPRMIMRGQGQRPTPEEIEKMRNEPPQQVTYEVHFSEYKKVDGVLAAAPDLAERERQRQRRVHDREVQAELAAEAGGFREEGIVTGARCDGATVRLWRRGFRRCWEPCA